MTADAIGSGGPTDAAHLVAPAGQFRVYLGAAAGVGKTYAMLNEGARRRARGTDIVIGFVETHGRPRTAAATEGFEVVPRKVVTYRGIRFEEMDTDAVMARHPAVALVDELAHTNVVGSGRHAKRWEDVLELVTAGIDIISTVNIQHLESVADAVERITGVAIRERVPDWVLRRADQIELVDSSPEALRRRMVHGNIYPAEKVPQALDNFFRTDNLSALRELALRFLADETDEQLLDTLRHTRDSRVWETNERILVAVTAAPGTEAILRRASRMASRLKTPLHAIHVITGDAETGPALDRLVALRQLAIDVEAEWNEIRADDAAPALIEFAVDHQCTQIVVGSSRQGRLDTLRGRGSFLRRLLRLAGERDLDVHVIARRHDPSRAAHGPAVAGADEP